MADEKQMSKAEMAAEIGRLEGESVRLEGMLRESERRLASAQGGFRGGLIGLLLGLILLFPLLPCGLLLIAAGVLAAVTGLVRQSSARGMMQETEKALAATRARLAELRAQL